MRIQIVRNFGTINTCRWHIKNMYCKKKDILVEYHFLYFFFFTNDHNIANALPWIKTIGVHNVVM